jgi:hypothetical protein
MVCGSNSGLIAVQIAALPQEQYMMLFKVKQTEAHTLSTPPRMPAAHHEPWNDGDEPISCICHADVRGRISGSHHGVQGRVRAGLAHGSAIRPIVL